MKRIQTAILWFCLIFSASLAAIAAQRPIAEILEFGVYSGSYQKSAADTNAPTGQVLLDGPIRLEKKTDQIPAKLKSKFGFRFVVHGLPTDPPVKLRIVYLFPEIRDPSSGRKFNHFEADVSVKPEDNKPTMLWDFTEPYELVSGQWTFQIFRGDSKILEKTFEVVKNDTN
jgi:hypothetical protein